MNNFVQLYSCKGIFYKATPEPAQIEMEAAFKQIGSPEVIKQIFIYLLKTARKYSFRIAVIDKENQLNYNLTYEQYGNGWNTPDTNIENFKENSVAGLIDTAHKYMTQYTKWNNERKLSVNLPEQLSFEEAVNWIHDKLSDRLIAYDRNRFIKWLGDRI